MGHKGSANQREGTSPPLSFCSPCDECAPHVTPHQEQKGLPGCALKDDLIRSSTERLCLTVLNEDSLNFCSAEGDCELIHLY